MGFLSFSMDYYNNQLCALESAPATTESVNLAKQLLKMLDDLLDEGYTELNEKLEETHQGVSRLRGYLQTNHAEPFPIIQKPVTENSVTYGNNELELVAAIRDLIRNAVAGTASSDDPFLSELIRFCDWIGYEEETAYIFLLRDTLLPYIHYQNKGRRRIHPWLLGRKTLSRLTGKEYVDDEIRSSIIKALEFGCCRNYEDLCDVVLPDIRQTLADYPKIEKCLRAMLSQIKETHILVVESGCSGTFPMLLKALDDRVDVRMYTTYPYLLELYGDRIYSRKYEENRLFETLYSQDIYFQFSDLRGGQFFVKKCEDGFVEGKAMTEVKAVL